MSDSISPAERATHILAQAAALTLPERLWWGVCHVEDLGPEALAEAAAAVELVLAAAEAHIDAAERRP